MRPSTTTLPLNYPGKARQGAAKSIGVLRQRPRPSVTRSKTYARPEPSAHPWRSETSAPTASKSSDCTKPMTIRCASLSDRAPAHAFATRLMGPLPSRFQENRPPTPTSKKSLKGQRLRRTRVRVVSGIGQLGAYLFLSHSSSAQSKTSAQSGLRWVEITATHRATVQCCVADHSFSEKQVRLQRAGVVLSSLGGYGSAGAGQHHRQALLDIGASRKWAAGRPDTCQFVEAHQLRRALQVSGPALPSIVRLQSR